MQDKPHTKQTKRRHKHRNIRFCIVKQLQFHPASEQIQEQNTTQISFYVLFNFHVQFTNKSVGSLWYC